MSLVCPCDLCLWGCLHRISATVVPSEDTVLLANEGAMSSRNIAVANGFNRFPEASGSYLNTFG